MPKRQCHPQSNWAPKARRRDPKGRAALTLELQPATSGTTPCVTFLLGECRLGGRGYAVLLPTTTQKTHAEERRAEQPSGGRQWRGDGTGNGAGEPSCACGALDTGAVR